MDNAPLPTPLPHPRPDFFRSRHRVYYFATGEFIQQSNGFRVPFYLCHILNELGFEAYVTAKEQAPNLKTPLLTPDISNKHKKDGREIVAVYTEAMWGNILNGDVVVRWILNRLGLLFDECLYRDEVFFFWDKSYSKNEKAAVLLQTQCVDPEVFNFNKDTHQKREGFAYYAHKYLRDFGGFIPEDIKRYGISLCHDIPRTHTEIADILRSVKVLYCFEDSAIILEAVACGCIVVLIKTEFTSYIGESNKFIDYVLDIKDFNKDNSFDYTGLTHRDFENHKKEIITGIKDFITMTQQIELSDIRKEDDFRQFIDRYKSIYIYGIGLTADVVYNTLTAIGYTIEGFIVSDDYFTDEIQVKYDYPILSLSKFIKNKNSDDGVITAMLSRHVQQVLPLLAEHGVHTFNPVFY
jgi:hypothetical protein